MLLHEIKSMFNNKFMKRHIILRDRIKKQYYSTEFSIIFDLTRLYLFILIVVVIDFDPFSQITAMVNLFNFNFTLR